MKRVMIGAMGHGHPQTVLSNDFFNRLDIDSSADWITDRIGIERRCSVLAREDIEAFIDRKVFLELHVKVRKDWRNNDLYLREYGY